jgi:CspA family cold shock protein
MMGSSGRVKFFSDRGFGFIKPDDGCADVFVHRIDLQESCRMDDELRLNPGDWVQFEVVEAGRGPKAVAASREGHYARTS